MVKLRTRVRKIGWRGKVDTFLLDLEAGKFDPDITELDPEPEPTSPVKDVPANGESSVNGGELAAVGPATEDAKIANAGDDEMQFNVEPEDETGDQEAGRADANGKTSFDARRSKPGEETSVLPEGNQVMIRTIPPDIGRVKLEDVSIAFSGQFLSLILVLVRLARKFLDMSTSLLVIRFKRGITIGLGGCDSMMKLICRQLCQNSQTRRYARSSIRRLSPNNI